MPPHISESHHYDDESFYKNIVDEMYSPINHSLLNIYQPDTVLVLHEKYQNLYPVTQINLLGLSGRLCKTYGEITNIFLPITPSSAYQLLHNFMYGEKT